ncbi:MAG: hypothetical protein CMM52_12905 [Rhodospirillaceae bacterium]|nr:hypothetical protein [Rhodospirillaceae bacterium]|tara:strand:+ start:13733 stop:13996 length:264 start_codon:yes stop_codon:yes gene_type:complete
MAYKYLSFFRIVVVLASAASVSGCAETVKSTSNEIHVDTGELGQLFPNSRHWMALPQAKEFCDKHSKTASLDDLKGTIVIYRCTNQE